MKKLLYILLFIPFALLGQGTNVMLTTTEASGASYGAEKLTNGDNLTLTDWGITGNISLAGGVASYTDGIDGGFSQQSGDMQSIVETAVNYRLVFTVVISSGNLNMYIGSSNWSAEYVAYADYVNGENIVNFTGPGSLGVNGLGFYIHESDTDNNCTIGDISLKEVL